MQSNRLNGGPRTVRLYDTNRWSDVIPPTLINSYSALTIPAFFRAVKFLCDTMASFPRSVRKDGTKPKPGDPPHPLDAMLRREPNGRQTPFGLFWGWWFHYHVAGNGYLKIVRDTAYRPVSLEPMPPEAVQPRDVDFNDGEGPQRFYVRTVKGREPEVLPAADVLHLVGPSWDGCTGMDPVALHAGSLNQAAQINTYLTRFIANGSMIRQVASFKEELSTEQRAQTRAELDSFAGPNAKGDTLILDGGGELKPVGMSPAEAQLMQQAAFATKQIAQIMGIPPEILFEQAESKYNDAVGHANQNVVRYGLVPLIEQAEDELTMKLLDPAERAEGYSVRLNPDVMLRGDTAAVNKSAADLTNSGIASENEGREIVGLPARDDPAADVPRALGSTAPPPTN